MTLVGTFYKRVADAVDAHIELDENNCQDDSSLSTKNNQIRYICWVGSLNPVYFKNFRHLNLFRQTTFSSGMNMDFSR